MMNKLFKCRFPASVSVVKACIVFVRDQVKNFDEIIEQANKKEIHVGWSNPCIEIWFHAYYGKMPAPPGGKTPSVKCCENFSHIFKKKTGKDYIKSNNEIYVLLVKSGNEDKAITLAEKKYKENIAIWCVDGAEFANQGFIMRQRESR